MTGLSYLHVTHDTNYLEPRGQVLPVTLCEEYRRGYDRSGLIEAVGRPIMSPVSYIEATGSLNYILFGRHEFGEPTESIALLVYVHDICMSNAIILKAGLLRIPVYEDLVAVPALQKNPINRDNNENMPCIVEYLIIRAIGNYSLLTWKIILRFSIYNVEVQKMIITPIKMKKDGIERLTRTYVLIHAMPYIYEDYYETFRISNKNYRTAS